MITREELLSFLNETLTPQNFKDYGPNGLHIEGKDHIKKIAFAVSAQRESIERAIEVEADCLIVHHGLFWKFHGTRTITGSFAKRVKPLIKNEINLVSYHLPLDAHIKYGNAAQLAQKLGLEDLEPFGDHKGSPTGVKGKFKTAMSGQDIAKKLENILNHTVIHTQLNSPISSMGIITGGANGDWVHCIQNELDSYLTGEISEHDWHEAREENIHFFAGGHNATEQFGIQAIQQLIEEKYSIETVFIPSNNPA